jgi:hypothetical protein
LKKISQILLISFFVAFLWPNFASAAPNLVGIWKGNVRKVTTTACPAPLAVTLTISQCMVGTVPGNLFNGSIKVGADAYNIVGKMVSPPVSLPGNPIPLTVIFQATGKISAGLINKEVFIQGAYIAATTTSPANIQISEFQVTSPTTTLGIEMYDNIILKK